MDQEVLAKRIGLRSPNKNPSTKAFHALGARVASMVAQEIVSAFGDRHPIRLIEFGAGSGRVALPLARLLPWVELDATDVDAEAVQYMELVGPTNLRASVNSFMPPLQFADSSYDCIYAISVWTHFPRRTADVWLAELKRIAKPEALLIISVAGHAALAAMHASRTVLWQVTHEQLDREKFVYREMPNLRDPILYPGVEGSWGDALIHPEFIRQAWGRVFEITAIREGHLPGKQDLVIMRRRG